MKRILLMSAALLMGGCATVYTASNFSAAQQRDKTVAILPFRVTVNVKSLPKGLTEAGLKAQEQDEAYEFQQQLYAQFLKRYAQHRYTVKFQDIDTTNALLKRNDVGYDALTSRTPKEIAAMLDVDAVISGSISRNQPMKTGAAIASTIFFGFGATNQVNITMTIHEGADGALLWSYNHRMTGGLGSSPETVAQALMKSIARRFPYERGE